MYLSAKFPSAVAKLIPYSGTLKFKPGDTCIISGGADLDEEWHIKLSAIIIVGPLEGHYHFFVDGQYFIPAFNNQGRVLRPIVHPWTKTHQLVPREYNRETVQPTSNLQRKVILYPSPEDLDNPQYFLPIDIDRPDAESVIHVPVYPLEGDDLKIQVVRDEIWFCKVVSVDTETKSLTEKYYMETGKQGIWTLQNVVYNLHFNSILKLVNVVKGPWCW